MHRQRKNLLFERLGTVSLSQLCIWSRRNREDTNVESSPKKWPACDSKDSKFIGFISKRTCIMKPEELRLLSVSRLLSPAKSFGPKDSVSQVIGYLRDSNLNEAFVEERESTTVATMRNMLGVQNIKTAKISSVTSQVPRLNLNNTVSDAALVMFEHRVRSLPVYERGKLIGKITSQLILRRLMVTELKVKISRIMTPNPACIGSSDAVSKARSIMNRLKIDQLPVLKGGRLCGVISSSSIVFNLLPPPDRTVSGDWRQARLDVPVESLSSLQAVTNEASDSVNEAFQNMERNSSAYSIILNLDEIQGIATHRDFMRFLVQPKSSSVTSMYIVGLPEEPFEAEATRAKFSRIVKFLSRGIQDISEARAIIKTGETKAAKKRYQVRVFIMTPSRRFSYDAFGYVLPDIFDEISSWAKSLVARGENNRRRTRVDPGLPPEQVH